MISTRTGLSFATSAALIAISAAAPTAPAFAKHAGAAAVHCYGVNTCKGQSDCKTAHNDCKGQNSCKGQGWVGKKSEAECKAAGGTVGK